VSDYAGSGEKWSTAFWGVLAAARSPITKHDVLPPLYAPGSWLEVRHHGSGLTAVGVRVPAWERQVLRRTFWEWMLQQFDRLRSVPTVVMGDFNTEARVESPSSDRRSGRDLLRSVTVDHGWRCPFELTGTALQPTYWHGRPKRLDHCFVSPPLAESVRTVGSPASVGDITLAGPAGRSALSDHSPIVIDISTDWLSGN